MKNLQYYIWRKTVVYDLEEELLLSSSLILQKRLESQPLFLDDVEVVNDFYNLCDDLLGNHHALHESTQVKI